MNIEELLENAPKEIKSERICLPIVPELKNKYNDLANDLRKAGKLHVLTNELRRVITETIADVRNALDNTKTNSSDDLSI